ncbi:hypothetical protein [Caldibacillus debilis]|uniref:Uncharacterized protein n=1 Tax=Caldibacillus debilis GB1 TaxID=1339248 RepID=A0A420VDZ2_9BACI|nr:hypothetical protein [Caldibacillus debilis]RKO61871.1 hypothetical protein Cdeb_01366 [Caldibacillus debilis GB1]
MSTSLDKKEVIKFFLNHYQKLGWRERKVFVYSSEQWISIEESKDNSGLYKISSPYGGFEFAWSCPFYERGTILG